MYKRVTIIGFMVFCCFVLLIGFNQGLALGDDVKSGNSKDQTLEFSVQENQNQTYKNDINNESYANSFTQGNESPIEVVSINNTTKVNVTINNINIYKFDSVTVDADVSYSETKTRTITKSVEYEKIEIVEDKGIFNIDLEDFAEFHIVVYFYDNNSSTIVRFENFIGVIADEYNIVALNGTLAVCCCVLDLWGDNSYRKNGPVILTLERGNAIDWEKLPKDETISDDYFYGVYGNPYRTKESLATLSGESFASLNDYVKSLLKYSPDSKFNLITTDLYCGLINRLIYSNDIKKYSCLLYLDGQITYNNISKKYIGSSLQENISICDQAVSNWHEQEELARTTKQPSYYGNHPRILNPYMPVSADENVTLVLNNKSLVQTPNDGGEFAKVICEDDRVLERKIEDMLEKNIKAGGDKTINDFKTLYKFNDQYFENARKQGKKIMLCIGTRASGSTSDNLDIDQYERLLMLRYGDDYCYYYKAHPATPTSNFPEKLKLFDELGIEDIDASIPAELIIFFSPDIFLCGYQSSTFQNIKDGMLKVLYRVSKEKAMVTSVSSYHNCDFWASAITSESDADIKSLRTSNDCYLVEFNDEILKANAYDFAVWDPYNGWLDYYKNNEGNYTRVFRSYGIPAQRVIDDGTYYISSYDSPSKVLDVCGGSVDNGANVQLYDFNGTGAQQWNITNGSDGYLTIINAKSGLALDVSAASVSPGANIQQWYPNGSDAQKWKAVIKDYKCTIVSALNDNIVIDVNAGILDSGSNIQTYTSNNTPAQQFHFCQLNPSIQPGNAEIADGYYRIGSIINENKVMDVEGKSMNEGANIHLWDAIDGLDNQVFQFTKGKDGFYSIISVRSGKAVDVSGACVIPGTNIHQWTYGADNKAQKWSISTNPKGGGYIFTNVATGLCMDLWGANTGNGTNIDAYMANGTDAQAWNLSPAITNRQTMDLLAQQQKDVIKDGIYSIKSILDNNYVLDVEANSADNCANIQLYSNNGTDAQKFSITHDEFGYITITNLSSGKVLDVAGGSDNPGTNVWQYESNSTYAQKWIAINSGDGIELVSAISTGISLDVNNGLAFNGANVKIWSSNNSPAQRWLFVDLLNVTKK